MERDKREKKGDRCNKIINKIFFKKRNGGLEIESIRLLLQELWVGGKAQNSQQVFSIFLLRIVDNLICLKAEATVKVARKRENIHAMKTYYIASPEEIHWVPGKREKLCEE